jgi:prepilin-type N-terminal cleavage/methylation domain-containing protein
LAACQSFWRASTTILLVFSLKYIIIILDSIKVYQEVLKMEIYTVNKVAKRLGISKQTLLRYEKKGIFPKAKRNHINHWREYTDKDIHGMAKSLGLGFTLIELVMVIVIIGILAGLAIPRFQSFYAIKLSGAARKVVSDLRFAQQLAISQHADSRIEFSGNTYRGCYCNTAGGACSSGTCTSTNWSAITDPFTRANLVVNFSTDLQYGGINIASNNFGGTLRFNWQGVPQNASGAPLTAEGSISLSYQGNNSTIYVTPNTGRVRLE